MESSTFSSSVGKLPDAVYVHTNKSWDRTKKHLLDISGSFYHLSEELTFNPTCGYNTAEDASSQRVKRIPMHPRDLGTVTSKNDTINVFLPKKLDQKDETQMMRKRMEQRYLAYRGCMSSISPTTTALTKTKLNQTGEEPIISTNQLMETQDETDLITNYTLFPDTSHIDTKPSHVDSPDFPICGDSVQPSQRSEPVKFDSEAIVSPVVAPRIPDTSVPNKDDISPKNQTCAPKTSPKVKNTLTTPTGLLVDADIHPSSHESTKPQTISLRSVLLVIRLQRRFRENRRRALKRIQDKIRLERQRSDNFCEKKIEKKTSQHYENVVLLVKAVVRVQRWYREYRRQRKLRIIEQLKLSKSRSVANLNQKLDIDAQNRQLTIASAVLMVTRIQRKFRKRRSERQNRIKQLHRRDSNLQLKHLQEKLMTNCQELQMK